MSLLRVLLCGFLFALFALLSASPLATADAKGGVVQLMVNTLADTSGTCSQNGNGTCSLRDVLTFANNAGGGSAILVKFSVTGSILLAGNLPNIKYNMTFDGSGQQVTISGQGAYRIFRVGSQASVTIKALTMANGNGVSDCGSSDSTCGGAIMNRGTLTVSNSVFNGNSSGCNGGAIVNSGILLTVVNTTFNNNHAGAGLGCGGAIYNVARLNISNTTFNGNTGWIGGAIYNNDGTLTLDGSTLSSNVAGDGAAIYNLANLTVTNSTLNANTADNDGGAIYNYAGTLTVNNSIFSNNSAGAFNYGGAIVNEFGTLSLKNSTVSGNYAEYGGGVYNFNGTASITKSTIANNTGWGDGGGLYNDHGTMNITNCTITENTAEGANGGGIYNFDGALTVINSTVYHNHSASIIHYAGGIYNDGTSVTLKNTVVANNSANQCYDYAESLTADKYNIDDDGTCGDATQHTVSGIALLALAANGGPTQTMKPAAISVLRNAGDNAVCAAAPVNGKDQRGVTRPQGFSCDVGAYEVKQK